MALVRSIGGALEEIVNEPFIYLTERTDRRIRLFHERPDGWKVCPRRLAGQYLLVVVVGLSFLHGAQAKSDSMPPRPQDPYADPENDAYNPLRYIASNTLTGIAFGLVLLVALIQTWCIKKWGAKHMLLMTIGAYTFAFGLSTRFGLNRHPESKGLYIVQYLFVTLSPCAFIAAEYVLLGRFARYLGCDHHLLVSPRRITLSFIISDVSTFLIQAAGGASSVSANDDRMRLVGSRIFLAGLALQLLSFAIFTFIYLNFVHRVRKYELATWHMDQSKKWYNDWRSLAGAVFISCIGVLIRSVYRTVEISEGFAGHLATTEAFFYALDTLPLFIAIVIYIPFWPGRFIKVPHPLDDAHKDSVSSD
ncbi:integral to membrane protein [Moniliophthora roreri MCA 2997]|uniref:Integral to membrane protein n=1 Tax=Moniliophthora roreri (strain MCA 2997) TaxID=1381753 RepID=V2XU45_MONRO|nr:integral to membrane protein [Moniliophthora roreri MCA 2997]